MSWIIAAVLTTILIAFGKAYSSELLIIDVMGLHIEQSILKTSVYASLIIIFMLMTYRGLQYIFSKVSAIRNIIPHNYTYSETIEELLVAVFKHDAKKVKKMRAKLKHEITNSPRLELIINNEEALLYNDISKIEQSFIDMLGCSDIAVSGFEGLINMHMQMQNWDMANKYACKMWELYPSDWLATNHICIMLSGRLWNELLDMCKPGCCLRKYVGKAVCAHLHAIAIYYLALEIRDSREDALVLVQDAYRQYGNVFMPLDILLAELLLETEGYSKDVRTILTRAWNTCSSSYIIAVILNKQDVIGRERLLDLALYVTRQTYKHDLSLLFLASVCVKLEKFTEAEKYLSEASDSMTKFLLLAKCANNGAHDITQVFNNLNQALAMDMDDDFICYYWDFNTNVITVHETSNSMLLSCIGSRLSSYV